MHLASVEYENHAWSAYVQYLNLKTVGIHFQFQGIEILDREIIKNKMIHKLFTRSSLGAVLGVTQNYRPTVNVL